MKPTIECVYNNVCVYTIMSLNNVMLRNGSQKCCWMISTTKIRFLEGNQILVENVMFHITTTSIDFLWINLYFFHRNRLLAYSMKSACEFHRFKFHYIYISHKPLFLKKTLKCVVSEPKVWDVCNSVQFILYISLISLPIFHNPLSSWLYRPIIRHISTFSFNSWRNGLWCILFLLCS